MIFDTSESFIGKYCRLYMVGGGYVEGIISAVEEGGILMHDVEEYYDEFNERDEEEDANYFIRRQQVMYIVYKESKQYGH